MGMRGTRIAAAALGLAAVVESVLRHRGTGDTVPYVLLVCLVGLATTVPVVLRHALAAPLVVQTAGALSLFAFHTLTIAGIAAHVLVFYRFGRRGWLPFAIVLLPVYPVVTFGLPYFLIPVVMAALVPSAMMIGVVGRTVRETAETKAARDVYAGTLVEHTARGERARIARELHDIVAHHISMIAVLAETTRLTTPGMPDQGAKGLRRIGDTARASLTEMRRLLGVLREDAEDTAAAPAARRPQPGLAQLNDLLDAARDLTGASTRLILRGTPAVLDPGVELAAFRIVQEALSNVRRHAPQAAVDVELTYTPTALCLLIRDNGPGPAAPPAQDTHAPRGLKRLTGAVASGRRRGSAVEESLTPTGGLGLVGMRERVAAVGGELHAGHGSLGGFLIEVTLPTDAQDFR